MKVDRHLQQRINKYDKFKKIQEEAIRLQKRIEELKNGYRRNNKENNK